MKLRSEVDSESVPSFSQAARMKEAICILNSEVEIPMGAFNSLLVFY